jgi:hypothetical protein
MTEPHLAERLVAMLERQARRRRAPRWVTQGLRGQPEDIRVNEEDDSRLVVTAADGARFNVEVRLAIPMRPAVLPHPWRPAALDVSDDKLRSLSYIVVDEIVEDTVALSVSPWPGNDELGRLVFPDEPALGTRAGAATLLGYFKRVEFRGDVPEALRMGYAFAARVRTAQLSSEDGPTPPPSSWLVPPIYDIHSPAREKAKEAFYAAVAPTLTRGEATQMERMKPRP